MILLLFIPHAFALVFDDAEIDSCTDYVGHEKQSGIVRFDEFDMTDDGIFTYDVTAVRILVRALGAISMH